VHGEVRLAEVHLADDDLDRDATDIPVKVTETGCSGGRRIDGKLIGPYIEQADGQLRVLYGVEPPRQAEPSTCVGNPPSETTLELAEPLGDRELVDASHWPLQPVTPWPDFRGAE
jgi:hypothetical protein